MNLPLLLSIGRFVRTLLGLLALLLAAVALPAVPGAADEPSVIRVHRAYGDGPVVIPPGTDRVRISFSGRRGDVVRLRESCLAKTLRGPSGRAERWVAGTWRLRATGRHVFVLSGCPLTRRSTAQLVEVRLKALRVDGDPARFETSRRYEDWATVVVPRNGRVQVRPTADRVDGPWGAMRLPGHPTFDIANWHQEAERQPQAVYLEAGVPVSNELGTMAGVDESLVPRAGQRVILFPQGTFRARALRTSEVRGTVNGPATAVSAERRYQEVGVRFDATGGQWVSAVVGGALSDRSLPPLALTGPDGSILVGMNHATFGGFPDVWYLPEPGSYRLTVRTDARHRAGSVTLATVRTLTSEVPIDGQPLTFTAQEPGEWVLATGRLPDPPYEVAVEPVGTTGWHVFGAHLPLLLCRSAFCGDGSSASVDAEWNSTTYFPLAEEGRHVFLVVFGEDQTGSVSIRLTPPA